MGGFCLVELMRYNIYTPLCQCCFPVRPPHISLYTYHLLCILGIKTVSGSVGCGSGIGCWGVTLGLIIAVVVLLLIPVSIIIGFCVFRQRRKKSAKPG